MISNQGQNSDSREEDPLLEGFRQNDPRALEIIYASNYRTVEAYVVNNSGRSADAKDVFQEAIMAAWLNVQEGNFTRRGQGSLDGYIFQIAKYKWLDRLKSKSFRSTLRAEGRDFADTEPLDESLMHETDEKLEKLQKIFELLDQKCATILKSFYYRKKSLPEIGEELGHDAATIKTFKYRCMKKLKSLKDKI